VTCLKINPANRSWAVTGQVGKSPAVFVWNTSDLSIKKRLKLAKNSRGVTACAISFDARYVATGEASNDNLI
jgi:WD40 repeat protein